MNEPTEFILLAKLFIKVIIRRLAGDPYYHRGLDYFNRGHASFDRSL